MLIAMVMYGASVLGTSWIDPRGLEQGVLEGHPEDLQMYMLEAAKNSPAVQAEYYRWLALNEGVIKAEYLDDPMFTYGYFVQSDMNEYKLALSQKFPWFGTLALRGDAAADDATAAWQSVYAMRNRVFADVKYAYYEYGFLGESVGVTDSQLEILEHTEEIVRSKYSLGLASEDALLRVQIEIAQVRNEKARLLDRRPAVSARLLELMGRAPGDNVPWPLDSNLPELAMERDDALDRIRENNPDLKRLDERIASREKGIALARKGGYPQLNLGMEYKEKTQSVSMRDEWMVSLGVSVPVWRKKVKADIEQARLEKRVEEYERMREEHALERASAEVYFRLTDGRRRAALYGETLIPQAEQSYESLQSAYATGRADASFLDLLDAVRVLLSFELESVRAKRDLHLAMADLQWLMGSY